MTTVTTSCFLVKAVWCPVREGGGNRVRSLFCREGFRLELLLFLSSENSQLRFESAPMLTNLTLWRCSACVGLHALVNGFWWKSTCLCMTRKDLTVNVIEKHIVMHYSSLFFCIVSRATWTQVCDCNNSRRKWFWNSYHSCICLEIPNMYESQWPQPLRSRSEVKFSKTLYHFWNISEMYNSIFQLAVDMIFYLIVT